MTDETSKPRIKIGSQRPGDTAATAPTDQPTRSGASPSEPPPAETPAYASTAPSDSPSDSPSESTSDPPAGPADMPAAPAPPTAESAAADHAPTDDRIDQLFPASPRRRLSPSEEELAEALGEFSMDDMMGESTASSTGVVGGTVELDQKYSARVIKQDRESLFVVFGGQHEGVVPLRSFDEVPEAGAELEVVPTRFLTDDGIYEVVVPGSSVDVQDWSDLSEGVIVDAKITGHNQGGLECDINQIRGFIPISHIALYRVENIETFVGDTLKCVVTEANPQRRNLVLSHRAFLEREREAAREKLLEELDVGQVREGTVTRLQDFGAFVDLGGIDGLIHVSQLSWDRIQHPKEVLEEGQRVKVRVEKVDKASGRIGLSYRDLLEDPWEDAEAQFPVNAVVEGTVSKIMDFGAFVRLAAGVEGLVHISELAHHRVTKVGGVVKEGETVMVKVLSFDRDSQRIGLSIKAAQAAASPDQTDETAGEADGDPAAAPPVPKGPLKGGLNRGSGGDQFGLKW